MSVHHLQPYHDPCLADYLVCRIKDAAQKEMRFMEVCGTHTMAIFRHGIRSLLPETITLLSGPGCPVCVTAQSDIDAFIHLARRPDVIVATFGDLMRVPGGGSSLRREAARGADVKVVYSPLDAVETARRHPEKTVVFPGIGFETTAPAVAAAILTAKRRKVSNFCVYSAHKTVPPALDALMDDSGARIDGFLLPGHVSVIIGTDAYRRFFDTYRIPCVVAGFEPVDILQAILKIVLQVENGHPRLENAYQRAVADKGNAKARSVMDQIFEPCDARWRGIGVIPNSGLRLKTAFSEFDASSRFETGVFEDKEPKGCDCGKILMGMKTPPSCPLFRTLCTPLHPVGPCMVSSEGTCAAYYRFSE